MKNIIFIDKNTTQSGFFDDSGNVHNGAVVRPLVCECTKELGGTFELYLELVNPDAKVLNLATAYNFVAAPVLGKWDSSGKATRKHQIFFITSVEKNVESSGAIYVKLYAKHIFYILHLLQMQAEWWNGRYSDSLMTCEDMLKHFAKAGPWTFDVGTSNISTQCAMEMQADCTYVGAILDDTGIIQRFSAELHRDNFYFSGNRQKEFSTGSATNPAFRFIYGKEIKGITETVDYTETVTTLEVGVTSSPA